MNFSWNSPEGLDSKVIDNSKQGDEPQVWLPMLYRFQPTCPDNMIMLGRIYVIAATSAQVIGSRTILTLAIIQFGSRREKGQLRGLKKYLQNLNLASQEQHESDRCPELHKF